MSDPVGTMSNGETENSNVKSSPSKIIEAATSPSPPATALPGATASDAKNDNEQRSPEFLKLKEHGLEDKVATRLEEIYKTGAMHNNSP